jgi:hypothetical protein
MKYLSFFILGIIFTVLFFQWKSFDKITNSVQNEVIEQVKIEKRHYQPENHQHEKNEEKKSNDNFQENDNAKSHNFSKVEELSSEEIVIPYVKNNKKLPEYYLTKKEAKSRGWIPSKGNLCEVIPNQIIGGDIFTNREKTLPSENGRIYYEADLNYSCGRRGKDRLVFSNDGLIYVTYNHYQTFEER